MSPPPPGGSSVQPRPSHRATADAAYCRWLPPTQTSSTPVPWTWPARSRTESRPATRRTPSQWNTCPSAPVGPCRSVVIHASSGFAPDTPDLVAADRKRRRRRPVADREQAGRASHPDRVFVRHPDGHDRGRRSAGRQRNFAKRTAVPAQQGGSSEPDVLRSGAADRHATRTTPGSRGARHRPPARGSRRRCRPSSRARLVRPQARGEHPGRGDGDGPDRSVEVVNPALDVQCPDVVRRRAAQGRDDSRRLIGRQRRLPRRAVPAFDRLQGASGNARTPIGPLAQMSTIRPPVPASSDLQAAPFHRSTVCPEAIETSSRAVTATRSEESCRISRRARGLV